MLDILGDRNEVNAVSRECEANFKNWLSMSEISEQEFLLNKNIGNFEILIQYDNEFAEYEFVSIGEKKNGVFRQIGERFVYEKSNMQQFEDLALLLIYIAKRLDNENSKAPLFMKRENFFFDKVKEFISNHNNFKGV